MRTDKMTLAFAYLRLSNEEAREGESSSIGSQRMMIQNYCKQHGITLIRERADGGFQKMLDQLEKGTANLVITKDLSRLGRDMREASYYAEQFFPEHGIRYLALGDTTPSTTTSWPPSFSP